MSFGGEDDADAHAGGLMNITMEFIQKMMLMKRGRGYHDDEGEVEREDDEVVDEDDGDPHRMTRMMR